MQKFIFILILISIFSSRIYAEEILFNVSTLNQYNLKNNTIVTFDYNQNSVAELFTYNVQNETKEVVQLYGNEEPYFLLSGFNGKEIVYVNFNASNNYYIDYYNTETLESDRLVDTAGWNMAAQYMIIVGVLIGCGIDCAVT